MPWRTGGLEDFVQQSDIAITVHPIVYVLRRDPDRQRKAISLSFAKTVADSRIFEKGTFVLGFYDVHSFSTRVAVALKILPDDPGSF